MNTPQLEAVTPSRSGTDIHSPDVFRLLVESVADYAIFVLDPSGIIASWNPGAESLQGYAHDEVIGKHFRIFYTPSDLAKDLPASELRIALETGRFENEGWRVRKDGTRFWASVVITRILDDNGKLVGFGKITRDLTERRQAELRYRLLVEGVLDYAIFSMDAQGYITSWNVGAQRIKGYKAEEIIGKHFSNFYTKEDRERGLPQTVLHTAATTGHFQGEGWRVRQDGSLFWASVVVTALRNEEGDLYGFSKVTRDVSERKALLDDLARHSEELEIRVQEREQSNAELEAFAYSVSHDLRAPLRAISGFADALREDYGQNLDQGARDYLNEIINAAGRMNSLVQDLLDYGRVARISMPLGEVSLLGVTKQALREVTTDPAADLTVDIARDLRVNAHEKVLTQIIVNLVSNAFKFHKPDEKPSVRVWAERRDGFVRLTISDKGIGIAPEHRERIWQVFERLHDRETFPGSGIGLAIVKRAVGRMHGNCGLESEIGKGSSFWIELPVPSANKEEVSNG